MSSALLDSLAVLCAAGGVIAGTAVLAATGQGLLALRIALELWTAAGLTHLAGPPSWPELASTAAVIALRQLVSLGLGGSPLHGTGLAGPLGRRRSPN